MSGVLHRTTHEAFRLSVRDDVIMIPSRIYTPEPLVALLCTGKPTVRDCLLTRHHNGFVRARAVGRLLAAGKAWTIPFIIQLVGEYIVQILDQIDDAFDTIDARALGDFVRDNPAFLALTKQRVASYWDCYYRGDPREDYVGFRLIRRLEALAPQPVR
jgi:hypothetical protein